MSAKLHRIALLAWNSWKYLHLKAFLLREDRDERWTFTYKGMVLLTYMTVLLHQKLLTINSQKKKPDQNKTKATKNPKNSQSITTTKKPWIVTEVTDHNNYTARSLLWLGNFIPKVILALAESARPHLGVQIQ